MFIQTLRHLNPHHSQFKLLLIHQFHSLQFAQSMTMKVEWVKSMVAWSSIELPSGKNLCQAAQLVYSKIKSKQAMFMK